MSEVRGKRDPGYWVNLAQRGRECQGSPAGAEASDPARGEENAPPVQESDRARPFALAGIEMNRERWKAIERWWAEQLGGVRVPVTGRQRGAAPDVAHDRYAIEVKAGRVMSPRLREGMAQAVASAAQYPEGSRTPLLCVSHSVGPGRASEHYVVLRLADWQLLTGDGNAAAG